jgi:UDP-2-acetamido-3-amino-2,3-dideoxy-glucuronate N-acetyltransferase
MTAVERNAGRDRDVTGGVRIHPTADVSEAARIGSGSQVWNQAQVREGVVIGENCIIGKDVYIDFDVRVGRDVKIQNGALIYHGSEIEDGVFVGPQACFTNDRMPRAINPDGGLKSADDWEVGSILVRFGASIGAGSILLPGIEIGRFALVGAGAVVTQSVPPHGLVVGNPARLVGYVCSCGRRMEERENTLYCLHCDWHFTPEGTAS